MLDALESFVGEELARVKQLVDKKADVERKAAELLQERKPQEKPKCMDRSHERGRDKTQEREKEKQKGKEKEREELQFRPMLSKKSLAIAAKLGDARERLTKARSRTPEAHEESKRTKRSVSGVGGAPRWEQLYTLGQFYKTKKDALRAQVELERSKENEATFQPDLRKSQLQYGEFTMPFEQRNRFWEVRRAEKLEEQAKELQTETQSLCTFKPVLMAKINTAEVKVSEFGKRGLVTYFERVQQAEKKRREERETQEKVGGKNWKNRITKPQEFRLGRDRMM